MNKDLLPQVFEIVSNSDNNKQSVCETFIYEPTNIEEEKLGYLYVVGQVISNEQDKSQIITFLNIIASKTSQLFYKKNDISAKDALEKTLKQINKDIKDRFQKSKLDWLREINLAIISIVPQKKEIYFAIIGKIQGLLWRRGRLTDITQNFNNHEPQEIDRKLFQAIMSGNVETRDKFVFSVPYVTNYVVKSKLKMIIDKIQYEPLESFKKNLNLSDNINLALIIINIGPLFKQMVQEPQEVRESIIPEPAIEKPKKKYIKIVLLSAISFLALVPKKLYLLIKKAKLSKKRKKIISYLEKLSKIKVATKIVLPKFSLKEKAPKISLLSKRLNHLKRKRILLGIIITFIVVLTVILLNIYSQEEPPNPAYDSTITIINDASPILDIKKYTLSLNAKGLAVKNDKIVLFDENSLYIFDLNTKKGNFILPEIDSSQRFQFQAELNQNSAYLSPNGKIALFDDDLINLAIKNIEGLSQEKILDMSSFENNIYLLTESGKILKYSNLNFSENSLWLNKHEDFGKNFVSLSVDGSIYILEKSGLIYKYSRGEKVDNFLITVEGMAELGDRIYTHPEFKNLYLMSSSQNKIYIFDKETQKLIKNISNPEWQNITNFYIMPDEKTIYLLDNSKIYKINF
jgi:hypothetical protein